MSGRVDIERAREALAEAAEAYSVVLDAFEEYADEVSEYGAARAEYFDVGESVGACEGAILDFREAIGDPDPDVRLAKIGRAFLAECAERGFTCKADGIGLGRGPIIGAERIGADGFATLVRRFLP